MDFARHPDYASIILPQRAQERLATEPLTRGLYPTRVGHFPTAHGHGVRRDAEAATDWLVMACYDGCGAVSLAGQDYRLTVGEVCVLPASVPHGYEADTVRPWSVCWLHMNGEDAPAFAAQLLGGGGPIAALAMAIYRRAFASFVEEVQAARTAADWRRVSVSLRGVLLSADGRQDEAAVAGGLDVRAIHRLMDRHLDTTLDLDDLARAAGLSRYHFSRRYKAATGESPIDAYIGRKMRRACELLQQHDWRVGDVARQLGYADAHYFSRLFRRSFGYSPREYREQSRN